MTEQELAELEDKRQPCEVFSRVVGYIRPVEQWNAAKKEEFEDRAYLNLKEGGKNANNQRPISKD